MAEGRPRVFVSSTVADFRDLRSTLKFWLSELGYDAQLSEYSDFAKSLDVSSFEACLDTVATADYYVLLIGSRVGSFYDSANRISVTRQEYRQAYKSFRDTGKPRILTFVRDDVWVVRQDRQALAAFLESEDQISRELGDTRRVSSDSVSRAGGANHQRFSFFQIRRAITARFEQLLTLSPTSKAAIVNHPSRFATDAASIFDFLGEVTKQAETDVAASTGAAFPVANWVHSFHGFSDIESVLRSELRLRRIGRAAVEANLRSEIIANATAMLQKQQKSGAWVAAHEYISKLRDRVSVKTLDDTVSATRRELAGASYFQIYSGIGGWLTTNAVDEAIRSGEFLEWDPEVHSFLPTLLHRALVLLRSEVSRSQRMAAGAPPLDKMVFEWGQDWEGHEDEVQIVPARSLLPLFAAHDRQENILSLSAGILAAIAGDDDVLKSSLLRPQASTNSERESIDHGTASRVRVAMWLGDRGRAIVEGKNAKTK